MVTRQQEFVHMITIYAGVLTQLHYADMSFKEEKTYDASYEAVADDLCALHICVLELTERNAGQPISKWAVTKIFDEIRDALGLPQLTPHKLRHLMLTHLMDYGLDLYEVSLYARHRSTASTEIYLHLADAKLARQLNHIQEQQWNRLASLFKERKRQGETSDANS